MKNLMFLIAGIAIGLTSEIAIAAGKITIDRMFSCEAGQQVHVKISGSKADGYQICVPEGQCSILP